MTFLKSKVTHTAAAGVLELLWKGIFLAGLDLGVTPSLMCAWLTFGGSAQ